jgi:hypothetical protein
MSNVRITAIGEDALVVEVLLGDQTRKWRDIEVGESADLSVGGNFTVSVDVATSPKVAVKRGDPSAFITPNDEPAAETPWVTGKDEDLPVGVDVLPEDGKAVFGDVGENIENLGVGADVEEAEPEQSGAEVPGGETQEEAQAEVVKTLEADSPLEVGSFSDLPNPFEDEEEAEDEDSKAQA